MSHVTTVAVKILSLDALAAAAAELGAVLVRGVTSYNWYGQSVGDYPLPEGVSESDLGKCAHVIRVPGVRYEVGVVAQKDGSFSLLYDFYGNGAQHDGQKLLAQFGQGLKRLAQLYSVNAATLAARARGYSVQRQAGKGGSINLVVSGGAM